MRIAWFSVLNNQGTGSSPSAYFTDLVLEQLSQRFEIDLFVDRLGALGDTETFHYLSAFERHAQTPYDIFFYQMEDSKDAYFCRSHLGLIPGVVLFHDYTLKDAGPEPLHNSSWHHVARKFLGSEKTWPKPLEEQYQAHPLAAREAALSIVPVFTNPKDHSDFKRSSDLRVGSKVGCEASYYLPYPAKICLATKQKSEIFTVGFCGSPGVEHRAYQVLEALEKLQTNARLLWLVSDSQEEALGRELLKEFSSINCEFLQNRSPARWTEIVSQCDVATHTFFSAYGQVGPYLAISMAHGLPCIVTDYGASEYLPDNVVYTAKPGIAEAQDIARHLEMILDENEPIRKSLAHSYAQEIYDVRAVSADLERIFRIHKESFQLFNKEWNNFQLEAAAQLETINV